MTATKSGTSQVVVVDGSNIATEGRSLPSLTQLNDAVMAFIEEFPQAVVTVVVDATFGHRIDKREAAEFDAAIANNELVAPPAGAIGRGDAFVLSIANKVGARILSNDSFQEFHGDYLWLFDEGRLIGGKPVPHVGWVFVERLPVKGPISRKSQRAASSTRAASTTTRSRRSASPEASLPMPVPSTPPPSPRRRRSPRTGAAPTDASASVEPPAPAHAPSTGQAVNDLLPFLDFVEHHPTGSSVNGVVESYSSHGAYVSVGDIRGYVPLRLMAVPPPRSAREVMTVGDAVTLVVTSFAPARRSIDLAVPNVAPDAPAALPAPPPELDGITAAPPAGRTSRGAAGRAPAASAKKAPAKKKSPAKKAAATTKRTAAAAKTPARKPTTPKKQASAAAKSPTKRQAATKQAAKQQATKKKAAAAPVKKQPAKKRAPAAATPAPARRRAAPA